MDGILAELSHKQAVSEAFVDSLRSYISLKHHHSSQQEKAGVFADAINRIVDMHLPDVGHEHKDSIKRAIFLQSARKNSFSIDYSDIFKASLEIRLLGNVFVKEMIKWLSHSLEREIDREWFFTFILKVYKAQEVSSGSNIGTIIKEVEKEVAVLPGKEASALEIESSTAEPIALIDNLIEEREELPNCLETNTLSNIIIADDAVVEPPKELVASCETGGSLVSGVGFIKIQADSILDWFKSYSIQSSLAGMSARKIVALLLAAGFSVSVGVGLSIYGEDMKNVDRVGSKKNVLENEISRSKIIKLPLLSLAGSTLQKDTKSTFQWVLDDRVSIPLYNHISRSGFERTNTISAENENIEPVEENVKISAEIEKSAINMETTTNAKQMKATAYDLSVQSCGKLPGDPGYGITYTGTSAMVGRTVAVDPSVIPLGSRLYITFPEKYAALDGIYIAEDTGSKVKGDVIDVFFGEDRPGSSEVYQRAKQFGVQGIYVEIVGNE